MRKGSAAVILQGAKQRVGIDLIAWAGQVAAAIIAAEIIAVRGHRAKAAKDVVRLATVQDGVSNLDGLAIPDTTAVAVVKDQVVAESTIADRYCPNGVDTTAETRFFEVPPGHRVAANSAIADRYCPTVGEDTTAGARPVILAAASPVAAHDAIGDCECRAARDAAAPVAGKVASDRAVSNRERTALTENTARDSQVVWKSRVGNVVTDGAVDDRQRPVVVNAAATEADVAAGGIIADDSAIDNRQCCAPACAIIVDATAPKCCVSIYRAVGKGQCRMIIQDPTAKIKLSIAAPNRETRYCDGRAGHDVEVSERV